MESGEVTREPDLDAEVSHCCILMSFWFCTDTVHCLLTVWFYFSVFLLPLRILSNLGKDGVVCVLVSFISHGLKEPHFLEFPCFQTHWTFILKKSIVIVSVVGKQTFFLSIRSGKKYQRYCTTANFKKWMKWNEIDISPRLKVLDIRLIQFVST